MLLVTIRDKLITLFLWQLSLLSLLRDCEDEWEWEMYGSTRSAALGHRYFQVSRDYVKLGQYEIIPYVFTGIIKGQWSNEVQPLFLENGIDIDLSIRGVYKPDTIELKKNTDLFHTINILCRRAFNSIDAHVQKWLIIGK